MTDINQKDTLRSIRLTSWNVRGLGGPIKRTKVLSHLKSVKTDIAFLQETHLRLCDHTRLRKPWVGQVFHSNFNSRSRGTAILLHKRVQFSSEQVISDPNGRYIIVVGVLFQTPVIMVCVYAPNWDCPNFMTSLFSSIPCLDTHHLIFGGDLNLAVNPTLDRSCLRKVTQSKAARCVSVFTDQIGSVDVWRFFHPTTKDFSFYSQVHQTYSRIDYFFLDKTLIPSVKQCEYSSIVISDHAPLLLDLELVPKTKSHSTWRLNTGLLSSDKFCGFISDRISSFLENNKSDSTSPSLLWETFKAVIRGEIISYSARIRKIEKQRQLELMEAILQIDRQHSTTANPTLQTERLKLQTEFDLISTNKAEFLLRRTKGTYYEYGNKASRLLARQLKHQSSSQFITQIRKDPQTLVTDPTEINNIFASYYSDLYKSEASSDTTLMNKFLNNLVFPSVDTNSKNTLDAPLRLEEVKASLKLMQTGKAPGPDGFPSEFYQEFSDQLTPLLLDMFNDSFEFGTLPPSLTQASISLIPKKNKDLEDCSSWRPVSLLNSDIKLLAKTLAGRLDPCLLSIISKDQTGFIRGRQLSSNIRRLLNIILSKPESQDPEMVITMDAEKAFDRVEWNYLFSVLNRFGFGQNFISWIKLLYNAPTASVRTNSTQSNFFPLTRGCRQGCPLSPLLFAVAIEPLSIAFRSSLLFTGVYRNGSEH